jgi:hypothetical protein
MPFQLTLNSILMLALGAVMIGLSVYMVLTPYPRMLAIGLFLTGCGCILCGLTDGFADVTQRGIAMRKVGIIAFIVGLPVLIYTAYFFV